MHLILPLYPKTNCYLKRYFKKRITNISFILQKNYKYI